MANLNKPNFSSAPFLEWTQRKVQKIKMFKKGHESIPKSFFKAQKFEFQP